MNQITKLTLLPVLNADSEIIDIEDLYKINDNRCSDVLCQYLHAFYWSTLVGI